MADYVFPAHLLDKIKEHWDAMPTQQGPALPDDQTLRQLLETCYHASFRTTEHRPVRCTLAYVSKDDVPRDLLLLFEQPAALTDSELVRLAPVTDLHRTVIGCHGPAGMLRIWGLFEHRQAWVQFSIGDPADAPVREADLPPDCLTVTIEAPGALQVARGSRALVRLREGRSIPPQEHPLRQEDKPLGMLFARLADGLSRPAFGGDRPDAQEQSERQTLLDVYTTTVTAILERIRSQRHGGSIVIARPKLDEQTARVTYTVAKHTGLADEMRAYHAAVRDWPRISEPPLGSTGELERMQAEAALRLASQRLTRGISQISLLAAVDGAVLLNGELGIEGFGVRFPVLLPPGSTVVDALTGHEYACDEWGLRHQSVFSVCQVCEEAVGLIVSQDGAVKAVKNVGGRLHLWDGVLD